MKYTSSLALTALFASADARRCNQFHPANEALGTFEFRNDKSEVFTKANGYGNSTNHMKFDKDGLFCVNLKSHLTNKGSQLGFYNGHTGANFHTNPAKWEKDATDGIFDFSLFYDKNTQEYEIYLNETDLWYHGKKDFGDANAYWYAHTYSAGEYIQVARPHRHCNQYHPIEEALGTDELRNDKSLVVDTKNGYGNSTNHMKFDKNGVFCINVQTHITNKGSQLGFYNGRTGANFHTNPAKWEKDATDGVFDFSLFYDKNTQDYEIWLNENDLWYQGKQDFGDKNAYWYTHLYSEGEYAHVIPQTIQQKLDVCEAERHAHFAEGIQTSESSVSTAGISVAAIAGVFVGAAGALTIKSQMTNVDSDDFQQV